MSLHGSPHTQQAFLDHHSIIPELNRVPARLRERTVPDSERNTHYLRWVGTKLDWPLARLEDGLAGLLENADDRPLSLPPTFCESEEHTKFTGEQWVWRFLDRVDVPD